MTVTLNLKPDIETEIEKKAAMEGTAVQEYVERLVADALKQQPSPPPLSPEEQWKKNQAAIEVLRQWREEDKTDDPKEIAQRQAELDEFMAAMNESHTSNRVIYP